jgi:N-acyl-D-glutamate deacylase
MQIMTKIKFTTALYFSGALLAATSALAQDYDLVINNGRVMDPETMFDKVTNVGIKDGRICEEIHLNLPAQHRN